MIRVEPCIESFKAGLIDKQVLLSVVDDGCKLKPIIPPTIDEEMEVRSILCKLENSAVLSDDPTDPFEQLDKLQEFGSQFVPTTPDEIKGYFDTVKGLVDSYNQNLGVGTFVFDEAGKAVICYLDNKQTVIPIDKTNNSVFDEMLQLFIVEGENRRNTSIFGDVFNQIHRFIELASNIVADPTVDLLRKINITKEAKFAYNRELIGNLNSIVKERADKLQRIHSSLPASVLTKIQNNYRSALMAYTQPVEAALATLELDLAKAETIADRFKPKTQLVSIATQSVQPAIKEEPKVLRFSEAAQILREAKEQRFLRLNPTKNLTDHYPKPLKRQNQYAMKIIAISNDYDLLSTSPADFYDFMENLFDWPNEGQKGSIYNTKKQKDLSWYQDIAAKLPEIRKDPTIEKSDGVVADIIGYVQELYKKLISKQLLNFSPVRFIDPTFQDLIDEARETQGAYEEEEMQRIVAVATATDNAVRWPTLLMAYTGARPSELFMLCPQDFNWENNTVYIDGTKTKTSKRTIPVAHKLLDLGLKELVQQYPTDKPFLTNLVYEQNLNARYQEMIKHLNLPETITDDHGEKLYRKMYSIRKAFSTWNGEPDRNKVEQVLGHSVRNANRAEEATYYKSGQRLRKRNVDYRNVVDTLPW